MLTFCSATFDALSMTKRPVFGRERTAQRSQVAALAQSVPAMRSLTTAAFDTSIVTSRPTFQRLTVGVQPHVIGTGDKLQVLKPIVGLVLVTMMDDQPVRDRSMHGFPDEMMLKHAFAIGNLNTDVSASHSAPTLPVHIVGATPGRGIARVAAVAITACRETIRAGKELVAALFTDGRDATLDGHGRLTLSHVRAGGRLAASPAFRCLQAELYH